MVPDQAGGETMQTATDEMTGFLSEWTTAELNGDTAALDRCLADDFTGVGPLGFVLTKQEWLARHAAGDLRYRTFELDDVRARVYGDAAVVVAHQSGQGSYRGNEVPGHLRSTLLLVQQSAAWRLAAIHMSFMAGTPGAPPIPGRP